MLFLKPWKPLSVSGSKHFEQELLRELGRQHPIYGRPVTPLAVTVESDDVLFRLEDDGTYAQIHLTFITNPPEKNSQFPSFDVFPTLTAWMLAVMFQDHIWRFDLDLEG